MPRLDAGVGGGALAQPCLVGVLARDERRVVELHALSATNTVWCVRTRTGSVKSGTCAARCARVMFGRDERPHLVGRREHDDAVSLARLDAREEPHELLRAVRGRERETAVAAASRGTPRGRSGFVVERRRNEAPAGPQHARAFGDRLFPVDTW